jgi:hypothetical protein
LLYRLHRAAAEDSKEAAGVVEPRICAAGDLLCSLFAE